MHAGRPCLGCQPADVVLHLVLGGHDQVGQLVDDYDDLGHEQVFLAVSADRLVVGLKVSHSPVGELVVAVVHLGDCPAQGRGSLGRLGDHGDHQMGDPVVAAEFDHLGIYQDELDLVG